MYCNLIGTLGYWTILKIWIHNRSSVVLLAYNEWSSHPLCSSYEIPVNRWSSGKLFIKCTVMCGLIVFFKRTLLLVLGRWELFGVWADCIIDLGGCIMWFNSLCVHVVQLRNWYQLCSQLVVTCITWTFSRVHVALYACKKLPEKSIW